MRILALMILGLMVVGCGKPETEKLEAELNEKQSNIEAKRAALDAEVGKLKTDLEVGGTVQRLNRELTAEEEKLVGSYEVKSRDTTSKLVLLKNGKSEFSTNGEKKKDGTWEMPLLRFELGKEVHVGYENSKSFYKIEPNGDLTEIANIVDGEREEVPKVQTTFTKIK